MFRRMFAPLFVAMVLFVPYQAFTAEPVKQVAAAQEVAKKVEAPQAQPAAPVQSVVPGTASSAVVAPDLSNVPRLPEGTEDIDYDKAIQFLAASIGGLGGASTLVIVLILTQLLAVALRSPLGNLAGRYRLLAIYLFTLVSGVLGLKLFNGVDWIPALLHSNTLAMYQLGFHQVKKQFIDKSKEPAVAQPAEQKAA